jgi:hypothetical protein
MVPGRLPGIRASDAERDVVLGRLRDEFVAGRLSHDTFLQRMHTVLEVKQQAHLPSFLADLPVPAPRRSLRGWLRGTWSRLAAAAMTAGQGGRPHVTRQKRPGGPAVGVAHGPVRSMTTGMSSLKGRQPLVALQFPRGSGDQFSIGRDANCDLAISDMTVSRRHAQLERTADGWLLTDLASTNGTRVNGWRVRGKVRVTPGDLVSFGNAEYALSPAGG